MTVNIQTGVPYVGVKATTAATPAGPFVGVKYLPADAAKWAIAKFGDAAKADLALKNSTNVNVLAAWLMTLPSDQVVPQTNAIATGDALWWYTLQGIVTALVEGELSSVVAQISANIAADATADSAEAVAAAAKAIADGNAKSYDALAVADKQAEARFADAKVAAEAVYNAWRGKVASDYAKKATDLVYTRKGTPLDPQFLQPIRVPTPFGDAGYASEYPNPYPAGFFTSKFPTPFAPIVSWLSDGKTLAQSQLILASVTTAAATEWNNTVLPAVQRVMDLAWLGAEVIKQRVEVGERAKIYTAKAAEFAAKAVEMRKLQQQIAANVAKALAPLPPFFNYVLNSAGYKLGIAKSAEIRIEASKQIQKLALAQASYTNYLAFLQQGLANVQVTGTSLFVDVAADLMEIGKANQDAALGAADAGVIQSQQASQAKSEAQTAASQGNTAIDVVVSNTETGKTATQKGVEAENEAKNKQTNGDSITSTSKDSADIIIAPPQLPPPEDEEQKGGLAPLLFGIGAVALLVKAMR